MYVCVLGMADDSKEIIHKPMLDIYHKTCLSADRSLLSGLDNMVAMLCYTGRQAVDIGQFIQAGEWALLFPTFVRFTRHLRA